LLRFYKVTWKHINHVFIKNYMSCLLSNRVFNAFGSGLILGALQETTGNIAYPIIAHMLHNSIPAMLAQASNFNP